MPRTLRTPRDWRVGLGACALLVAAPFAAAAFTTPAHGITSTARAASAAEEAAGHDQAPTVNWALSGSASATSVLPGDPASNAIDGDAGTDWCTWGWTGTLTVDLGQARALDDLGITLDASSPSASAAIQLATTAGDWQPGPELKDVALDPGSPLYLPLPGNTTARYAEITVYSDTGANVCVGEFRAYGPDPAAAGMDLGADLSFTPQDSRPARRSAITARPAPRYRSCARRRELRPDAAMGRPATRLQRPRQ